jgi:hypothetical protein
MEIDISKTYSGHSENYQDDYKLKSSKILNSIREINKNMNKRYNSITIPISIFNIIECDDRFRHTNFDKDSELKKVGVLDNNIECYLDLYSPPNQILISWDIQTLRDVKINNILNGLNEKEKRVKIIS